MEVDKKSVMAIGRAWMEQYPRPRRVNNNKKARFNLQSQAQHKMKIK